MLVSDTKNDRAPHLAAYGTGQMLAAWEESTTTGDFPQNDKNRQMYIQVLDSTTGAAPAGSSATSAGPLMLSPNVLGSRYQDFRAYPTAPSPIPRRAAAPPRSRSSASSAARGTDATNALRRTFGLPAGRSLSKGAGASPSRSHSPASDVSAAVSGVPALMRIGSRPPLRGLAASAQA